MFIYNSNQNPHALCHHILDPNYNYHSHLDDNILCSYFEELIKPCRVQYVSGIYIEYSIDNFPYHQFPIIYQKISIKIQEKIKEYLDFGCANLFNNNSNCFFITMFNIDEYTIQEALLPFLNDINTRQYKRNNKFHSFHIKSGIYISQPYINPIEFYNRCKEQHSNSLHHGSLISVKSYIMHYDD